MKSRFVICLVSMFALLGAAQAVVYRPGLIQAKFNTQPDFSSVIATDPSAERVPGTVMADIQANESNYATQTYSNTVTGTKYAWNRQNTTFGYAGQMFAQAGTTYTFGKYLDDGARIIVGGRQIMDHPTWNAFVTANFVTNATGWYNVEIRIYDGSGGKGPSGGDWGNDLGLGCNTNGLTTMTPKEDWTRLRDPGDMSWFRTLIPGQSYSGVASMLDIGGSIDVEVAYTNLSGIVTATAYTDSADRGTSAESWATSTSLGTVPAGTGVATLTIPYDPTKPIARILLSRRGVGDDVFDEWLDPIDLSEAPAATGLDFRLVPDPVFTNALVTLTVTSMGEASSAQFTLLVSPNADYSDPVFSNDVGNAVTAVDDFVSVNLAPLATETVYYVKAVLAGNGESRTRETFFTTGDPVPPAVATTYDLADSDEDSAVFSGVVSVIGTSLADVFFDYSTTSDFASYTTVTLWQDVDEPFSFDDLDVAIPSGQSVYGRVRVVNDWDFTTYSETMYFSLGPVFTAEKHASFLSPAFAATFTSAGRQGTKVTRITLAVWDNDALTGSPVFTKDYTVDIAAFPATSAILQALGVGASQTYYARVEARNDEGNNHASAVIPFTTPAAGDNVWANTSSDVESAASYVYTWGKPAADKILYFETPAVVSPVIASDTTMPTLSFGIQGGRNPAINGGFNVYGYEVSGAGKITLNDESPIRQSTYGTNTIHNPILFNRSNGQNVKLNPTDGSVVFAGPLSTPAGSEVVLISQHYGNLHFRGDTRGMGIKQMTLGETAYIYIENANALTNAMKIFFDSGWGAHRRIQNNTGAPLVFATTNIAITLGWSCPRIHFYGAPFRFPQATFVWSPRADDNYIDADVTVSDLVLRRHDGDSRFNKRGDGIFSVTNATTYYDDAQKNYVRVYEGCYNPQTDAAWAPSGQVFIENSSGTVGLNEDYYPMMDASHDHKVLGIVQNSSWGFTAFGGDRIVCFNNDPSFAVTNATASGPNAKFTDSTTVAQLDPTKKLSDYYAWPKRFVFGNRSPLADGTILFKNPMEQGFAEDQITYFESTNRVVAVRLQGKINVAHIDRSWYFDGRNVGGTGAVEADNTSFIGRVTVRNRATLLVNGPFAARSFTVATGSSLGGTNRVGGAEGVTVQTGGTICGGEYGRGGSLTVDSAFKMEANAMLKAEIPADPAAGVGYVKLTNTDTAKTLSLTSPIKVRIDADPAGHYKGSVKLLDWSGAVFKDGTVPQLETFVPDIPAGSNVRNLYLSIQGTALYANYVLDTVPLGSVIVVR